MDQTFTGPVGQVAGGDIHNHGPKSSAQCSIDELHVLNRSARSRLWAARRRKVFNLANLVFTLSVLALTSGVLYVFTQYGGSGLGLAINQLPPWVFVIYAIFGVGLPLHFIMKTQRREDARIRACLAEMEEIDIELDRRN